MFERKVGRFFEKLKYFLPPTITTPLVITMMQTSLFKIKRRALFFFKPRQFFQN